MALALGACTGPLSTLDPAGPAAAAIARIWWVMLAGAGAVLTLVMVLVALTFLRSRLLGRIGPRGWLLGGGILFPAVTLTALGGWALVLGESLLARPVPADVFEVRAVGRQWEWRFGPPGGDLQPGRMVIPAGRPVDVLVTSEDVIHSFWVPRLAGKIDAIPGHVNVIRIMASAPGIYEGVCAEYCGIGHAVMPFVVEAVADGAVGDDRLAPPTNGEEVTP